MSILTRILKGVLFGIPAWLLDHKKLTAGIITPPLAILVAWVNQKLNIGLTVDQVIQIVVWPLLTFIAGQAVADHGKEAAKIQSAMTAEPKKIEDPTKGII